jgi:hypothetical protein
MDDITGSFASQLTPGPIVPLTLPQWEARIDRETTGKRSQFRFLERRIFSSRAWRALSLVDREILLCYLNKVQFEVIKNKRPGRRDRKSVPLNANHLIVTNGEIKARGGVRSDRSISKARKELVRIGFLEAMRPGAFPQPGVYALSDRFLNFPDGNYEPQSPIPAGFSRYSRKCPAGTRGFPPTKPRALP